MLSDSRMPVVTHIVIDESAKRISKPLTRSAINKIGAFLFRESARLAEFENFKKLMGARPTNWTLLFCDDRRMRKFQREFRKLDRSTDVLSFPTLEQKELRGFFKKLPPSERSLGDVIISLPAVQRGARRGKRSVREECLEVLVHAFLHLLGFDHVVGRKVRKRDAERMRELQKHLFHRLQKSI